MASEVPTANIADIEVVTRMYELSRNGDTTTREFQLLDFVILRRLQQTYGGEIQRSTAFAA
ncbi:MAG: hypothetical protein E6Q88_10910 [Lysobacteraceae bacterium]|nr:MAG: hypothetical protein E6Q88_10910 [Xanthomonadaceae bacterium]